MDEGREREREKTVKKQSPFFSFSLPLTSRFKERMMVSVVMSRVTRVPGVREALSSLDRQPTT